MSSLSDKVAYLRGLAEGLKIDAESNEGKLLVQLIDVMGNAAQQIADLNEAYQELSEYVECVDNDLEALESNLEHEMQEEEPEFDGFDEDADFEEDEDGEIDIDFGDDESDSDDDEDDHAMYIGCICSECNGTFCIDGEMDSDQLYVCPHCAKPVKGVPMNAQSVPVARAIDEDELD